MSFVLPPHLYIATSKALAPGPNSSFALGAGDPFHADNRMGLTGTLHRISAIRDRDGSVIGLTYRIGRHVAGMFAPF